MNPEASTAGVRLTPAVAEKIKTEMHKVIVGQRYVIDHMIAALLSRGHVLLEGVPGTAKTLMGKALAAATQAEFKRIQFTPDLMPSDVIGTNVFDAKTATFVLKKGPIFTNLVLIDEVNRAPAKTQAALLEVMEERQITIDGRRHVVEEPFMVMATQNPIEYEGTYALPEAQLDRFLFKILIDYPQEAEETGILENYLKGFDPHDLAASHVTAVVTPDQIRACREELRGIKVEEGLLKYIAQVIRKTRDYPGIAVGASPRAGVALLQASRTYAAMNGRDYVTPDDVKFIARPVLRHRLMLQPETELEGIRPDEVIADVLNAVPVPR